MSDNSTSGVFFSHFINRELDKSTSKCYRWYSKSLYEFWKLIAKVWIPHMLQILQDFRPSPNTFIQYVNLHSSSQYFQDHIWNQLSGVLSGLAHLYYGVNATDLGQGESEQGQIIGQTLNCFPQCGNLTEEFQSIIRHCLQKILWPLQWRFSMASLAKKKWLLLNFHGCHEEPCLSRYSNI